MFNIEFSNQSKKFLKRCDKELSNRIIKKIDMLKTDPVPHDSLKFEPLVKKTAENFTVKELLGDKAYSSRANLDLVNSLGGIPYIPFKLNTSGKSRGSYAWMRMYHYFMLNNEDFMKHYHKRSNSETVFHMIKSKFKANLRSKDKIAQHNELLLKVICHNICVVIQETYELGINPNFINNQTIL